MKFSDDLYQLIQSLNQSEKRYVKLVAKAFTSKGTKKQLALFDAFDKQKTFDEQKIRDNFKERIPKRNFHVAKNRLYNLILKALSLYHTKNSEKEKINQLLFQAALLLKKGLRKQAENLQAKALSSALENECYPLAMRAYQQQANNCLDSRDIQKIGDYLDRELEEEYAIIEQYKTDITYHYLQLKALFITHQKKDLRSEKEMQQIKALKNNPLLASDTKAKTKHARYAYLLLNGFIRRYEGNYQEAIYFWEQLVQPLDKVGKNTPQQIEEYIRNINNMMFLNMEALQFEKAWDYVQKLVELLHSDHLKNNPHLQLKTKERIIEFKLEFFLTAYQYQEAIDYVQSNQEEIEAVCQQVDDFRRLVIRQAMSIIYFANEMYEAANASILLVLENKTLKQHQYIHVNARILQILIHFELQHYQLLDSLLLNTYRMLYKRELLYRTERIIFKYLKQFLRTRDKDEILAAFQGLKSELQDVQADRFEKNFMPLFDLVVWIESKIQQKPMLSIVNERGLTLN